MQPGRGTCTAKPAKQEEDILLARVGVSANPRLRPMGIRMQLTRHLSESGERSLWGRFRSLQGAQKFRQVGTQNARVWAASGWMQTEATLFFCFIIFFYVCIFFAFSYYVSVRSIYGNKTARRRNSLLSSRGEGERACSPERGLLGGAKIASFWLQRRNGLGVSTSGMGAR